MLEESPQSGDPIPETIPQAVERYLEEKRTAQGGDSLAEKEAVERYLEKEAIKSILEKVNRSSLTEEGAVESVLERTRQFSSHGENIPDEDNENLRVAMENVHTGRLLFEEYDKFSRNKLVDIAFILNEANKALGKLLHGNKSLIGKLQKELDAKVDKIFNELADHMRNPPSRDKDEQRTEEVELGTIFKKEIIRFLREAEEDIEFIRDSYLSNLEILTL